MNQNQSKSNDVSLLSFTKITILMDPHFNKAMEGNYETIVNCQTIEEYALNTARIIKNYLRNEDVPLNDRIEFMKYLFGHDIIPESKALFQHIDEKSKHYFRTLFDEKDKMQKVMIETLSNGNSPTDENLKEMLLKFIDVSNHQKKNIEKNKVDINQIIDPFYLEDYQQLVEQRQKVCDLFHSTSPQKIEFIMKTIDKKFIIVDENDPSECYIDVEHMNRNECEFLRQLLMNE